MVEIEQKAAIRLYTLSYHEWALKERRMMEDHSLRIVPPTEPILPIKDNEDELAFPDNIKALEALVLHECGREIHITRQMPETALKELECFGHLQCSLSDGCWAHD